VKARKVKGLEPDGLLAENAVRIARVRIDEVWSFAEPAHEPDDVKALHDMRIAAKRLRYLLELMEPCLGEPAARGARAAKKLQSLLGEIHDCDELLPLVKAQAKRLRADDRDALVAAAAGAPDIEPPAGRAAPHRTRHRGLVSLRAYLEARREVLFARFLSEWAQLGRKGFRERLEEDLRGASEATARAAQGGPGRPRRPAGRRATATMAAAGTEDRTDGSGA
jgi:hypothetical protein